MRFTDRVVVVTGAASGIGLATACRLGSEGARVVAVVHSPDQLERTVASVRESGAPDVWGCPCDVADESAVEACVAGTVERWGRIDGIVNNAGTMGFRPFERLTTEDWTHTLGVDLMGPFYFLREAFRWMTEGGAVVNVSSIHAGQTTALVAPYAAAKAALVSLTRSASIEGRPKGIRVNAVLPGAVDTQMLWSNPNIQSGVETINPEDVGSPESIAGAVAFLLSDDAEFVHGAALLVDGGRLSHL